MQLLPQKFRLMVLGAYVILLLVVSFLALAQWVPPFGPRGLWFYSGLYAFLVASLVEAPTHVTPAQALAFAALAALGIVGFGVAEYSTLGEAGITLFWVALGAELLVMTSAAAAILLKDTKEGAGQRLGQSGFLLSSVLGRPEFVSFAPFLFALVAFHVQSPREVLALTLGWTVLVFGRPIEHAILLSRKLRGVWGADGETKYLGEVIGHGVPGVVTIRHRGRADVAPSTPLLVPGEDGTANVAIALNYVGVADGLWLKALQLELPSPLRSRLPQEAVVGNRCARLTDGPTMKALEDGAVEVLQRRERLIGVVAPGTNTKTLHVDVVRSDQDLSEGSLLEAKIGDHTVLYQLLDGLTSEDILERKSTRGFVLAKARKIGSWNPEDQTFEPVRWVPEPNTPVFLAGGSSESGDDYSTVGRFPGTSYPVRLSIHDLVTHNAAVLGILGVGKTFLALELVERMLRAGVRVLILDLTNQYEQELEPYLDVAQQERLVTKLQKIGAQGKDNVQKHVEEGGSVAKFSTAVNTLVTRFLDPGRDHQALVLNPSRFEVWRQDSKPYQNKASMASLTAAEITRIVSEAALEAVQAQGMTDMARCCLVYEEAHSLVPEWNAVAYEGDKTASNGTARAILQGRKFGLGCLVVTQRTASVTKTVLNQCNTIFAMRVFDATGMDFLANYIGHDYSAVLSQLQDRHAVMFGKASSCADPVLIRVNDRDDFLRLSRGDDPARDSSLDAPYGSEAVGRDAESDFG